MDFYDVNIVRTPTYFLSGFLGILVSPAGCKKLLQRALSRSLEVGVRTSYRIRVQAQSIYLFPENEERERK
jgi:hypothetical protein